VDRVKDAFEPGEGGVKIVFDVPEPNAHDIALQVSAAGFTVHRYYSPDDEHRRGRPRSGYVRLGAERRMRTFTDAEIDMIVADFDRLQAQAGFACRRVGTDSWTAGSGGTSGDREPRTPPPTVGAGSAGAEPGPRLATPT
jgi:hypothetical protein